MHPLELMNSTEAGTVNQSLTVNSQDEIIVQSFDIEEPLFRLRTILEELWQISLEECSLLLQGIEELDESKSIREHGIEGYGNVQIKLQLVNKNGLKAINILDVLKLDDDELSKTDSHFTESTVYEYVQWIESKEFEEERERYGVPSSLEDWTVSDVQLWLLWSIQAFKLKNIDMVKWEISGHDLKQLTLKKYEEMVPSDVNTTFWTHIQILKECGQVAVNLNTEESNFSSSASKRSLTKIQWKDNLWKFLLDLLTAKEYKDIIRWINDDADFEILQPQKLALLWGVKRNRKNMTYEKFSRALRYYYEDKLSKVPGQRFVYKFNMNVKELIGYSPTELSKLLNS